VQQQIKDIFQIIAFVLNVFAGLVIAISALDSAVRYIMGFGNYLKDPVSTDMIRLRLGKSLSFALEFLVGADILRTLIAPSLTEISLLGATVAIRVTLNFFLEREANHLLSTQKLKPNA
jgi:uncharacterized membrane protein